MKHNRSRRRKLAETAILGDDAPNLPGVGELHSMCANARKVAGLCDLLGVSESTEDPDNPDPYFWEEPHA